MRATRREIDEYTLAAYLSGRLDNRRRKEVAAFLADNADARDLLIAARDLLDAEGDGKASDPPFISSVAFDAGRRPSYPKERSLRRVLSAAGIAIGIAALATLSVFAVGVMLDLFNRPGMSSVPVDISWPMAVQSPLEGFWWEPDPEAARYVAVVWDEGLRTSAARIELDVPQIDYETLLPYLGQNGAETIWVEALDAGGRLLRRSPSIRIGSSL